MKNLLIILCLFTLANLAAQSSGGRVVYTETLAMDLANKTDMDPGMKALLSQLPKESSKEAILLFNDQAATYTDKPASAKDLTAESGGNTITFQFSESAPEVYYTDLVNKKTLQKRYIFEKAFQIEDDLSTIDWTISSISKTDENSALPVQKATGITTDGDTLTAWYTASIRVSIGPRDYHGLPGLIVRLEVGKRTYQLTQIELLSETPEIPLPYDGGKTITVEKFQKTEEKKMEAFEKSMNAKAGTQVISIGG